MNPFISQEQEQVLLELRVDQLESRLLELQQEVAALRAEGTEPTGGEDGEEAHVRRSTEGPPTGSDSEQEGARLVTLEMLSLGYTREQVATYLRRTFAIDDPETLLAEAGAAAG